jgi:quercetin dioxygenase-like cupin family protein
MSKIKHISLAFLFALSPCAASLAADAPQAISTALLQKDLTDASGKEVLVLTVEYPPGSVDPVHRHNAHGFIYVLEGSIVMQVRGGAKVTLKPGQMFYEGPDDIHTVGRNASNTKPAKFLVFFVKNKGAEFFVPTK